MTDYLADKRKLPKAEIISEKEIKDAIASKHCNTCDNYSFYACKALNKDCGPEGSCLKPSAYRPKAKLLSA